MNRKGLIFLAFGLGFWAPMVVSAEEPIREEPLPWQESSPTARMFLQLPFETPVVTGKGDLSGEIRFLYANSIMVGSTSSLAIDVDVESAEIRALFRYGFAAGFEAQIAVPVIVDYGGFLDGAIEATERIFGAASMPHRRDRPHNRAHFRITRPDGAGIVRDGAGAGLGDVWAGFKVLVTKHVGMIPAVAFRAAIKVPTGRPPYGSGAVDVGGSLLLGWTWRRVNLWIAVDAVCPTTYLEAARISTHAYGATHLGIVVPLSDLIALNVQWSFHSSPFSRSGIPQLDAPVQYQLLGVTIKLSRSVLLQVAAVENFFSPASGVDFAMLFGLRIQPEKP
jgi:hypothetical protein